MYKIIKYTVQKTMSGELAQRALDWWAGLVEHLFGLPERTPEQEKAVVPAAEDHSTRNKVLACQPAEVARHASCAVVLQNMLCIDCIVLAVHCC